LHIRFKVTLLYRLTPGVVDHQTGSGCHQKSTGLLDLRKITKREKAEKRILRRVSRLFATLKFLAQPMKQPQMMLLVESTHRRCLP
jgi:hypothetical protein